MTRGHRLTAALCAGLFLALHLPFLPPSLEDLDSINFALGVRHFDVAQHQPHPPGYPVFIAAAKILHTLGFSEVHALSLLGVLAGSLSVFALLAFFESLDGRRHDRRLTWLAAILVLVCPLYWLTAARPLSDMMGLAAALGVQALLVTAATPGAILVAAACASLAAGIRSQVVWLTAPLLLLAIVRLSPPLRGRALVSAAGGYLAGALVWLVPLVVFSGGPRAYWGAFFSQGAEDLSGVVLLATRPSVRALVRTLQYAFVWPWGYWPVAAAVLAVGVVGASRLLVSARASLMTLAVAYGPYLVFDLLFQESITTRYALPLVVPVTYLFVQGLSLMPPTPALALGTALAMFAGVADDRSGFGYAQMDAPVFRLLGDMQAIAKAGPVRPVLAMHRRETFDLRRPFQWVGDALPTFGERLSTPPKHEWLQLVQYWNRGGRDPVWFIADPLRSDLALVRGSRRPIRYRWPFDMTVLLGGARPNELDWQTIDPPEWYLGEGWDLTPETAGVSREDHRGPSSGPISGWIRRWPGAGALMIGGRNHGNGGRAAHLRVAIDGVTVDEADVPPGFFLRTIAPASLAGTGDYATVTVEADSPDLAIEQFDAQPSGRVIWGFDTGWNELEYNPASGVLWRWSSDRSVIRLRAEGHAIALSLRGVLEETSSSHVVVRAADRVVGEFDAGKAFERTLLIPKDAVAGPDTTLTIESSASYVPAETRRGSPDHRRLGLKLYECSVTPAS